MQGSLLAFCQLVLYKEYTCWGPPWCNKQTQAIVTVVMEAPAMDSTHEKKKWLIKRTQIQNPHAFVILSWLCMQYLISDDYAFTALGLLWYPNRGCTLLIHFPSDGKPFQITLLSFVLSDMGQECHIRRLRRLGHSLPE